MHEARSRSGTTNFSTPQFLKTGGAAAANQPGCRVPDFGATYRRASFEETATLICVANAHGTRSSITQGISSAACSEKDSCSHDRSGWVFALLHGTRWQIRLVISEGRVIVGVRLMSCGYRATKTTHNLCYEVAECGYERTG